MAFLNLILFPFPFLPKKLIIFFLSKPNKQKLNNCLISFLKWILLLGSSNIHYFFYNIKCLLSFVIKKDQLLFSFKLLSLKYHFFQHSLPLHCLSSSSFIFFPFFLFILFLSLYLVFFSCHFLLVSLFFYCTIFSSPNLSLLSLSFFPSSFI